MKNIVAFILPLALFVALLALFAAFARQFHLVEALAITLGRYVVSIFARGSAKLDVFLVQSTLKIGHF